MVLGRALLIVEVIHDDCKRQGGGARRGKAGGGGGVDVMDQSREFQCCRLSEVKLARSKIGKADAGWQRCSALGGCDWRAGISGVGAPHARRFRTFGPGPRMETSDSDISE